MFTTSMTCCDMHFLHKRGVEKLAPNVDTILLKIGFYLDFLFSSFTPLFVDFRPYGWYHINIWKIWKKSDKVSSKSDLTEPISGRFFVLTCFLRS